jgi:hypothetical protein
VNVEQQRPAGVTDIRDVQLPSRQPPREKCVDSSEEDLATLSSRPQTVDLIEQVSNLRPGKVRIQDQSGLLLEQFFVTVAPQLLADFSSNPTLPDDRVGDWLAGVAFPKDRRLSLIGDANRGEPFRTNARLSNRFLRRRQLRFPDRFRIVLDVSRLRKELREFLLSLRDSQSVF